MTTLQGGADRGPFKALFSHKVPAGRLISRNNHLTFNAASIAVSPPIIDNFTVG